MHYFIKSKHLLLLEEKNNSTANNILSHFHCVVSNYKHYKRGKIQKLEGKIALDQIMISGPYLPFS